MFHMDVFECTKSFCLFSAVTKRGLATHISMAPIGKLVHQYNGDDNKRTIETIRDVFNCVPRRVFGHAERVRVDRAVFFQNDANFNESTLAVEENI